MLKLLHEFGNIILKYLSQSLLGANLNFKDNLNQNIVFYLARDGKCKYIIKIKELF